MRVLAGCPLHPDPSASSLAPKCHPALLVRLSRDEQSLCSLSLPLICIRNYCHLQVQAHCNPEGSQGKADLCPEPVGTPPPMGAQAEHRPGNCRVLCCNDNADPTRQRGTRKYTDMVGATEQALRETISNAPFPGAVFPLSLRGNAVHFMYLSFPESSHLSW